ncbi:MAG: hypothetical protein H6719_08295 [Sandaracinaceae bacterium]|nr:hypothetical protein [Sandaracinaceae bacterium]
MNVSRDVAEAVLQLGGEIEPWVFGRIDARHTTVAGRRFEEAAEVSAFFVEVRWPDAFFRTPDDPASAIRMRFVEQRFVDGERAFATFALDVVSGRTWSLALSDPELEVHTREGFAAPAPTGIGLASWLRELAPTDPPEADRTTWARELAGALRRGDLEEARAVVERVGPRARHPSLGTTPLHHVALAGTLELFDELVASGAPLDAATTQDGDTPFVYAAWGAQPAILERCLALHGTSGERELARALDHALMFDKVVPADAATSRDPARVVERLLACGADPLRAPEDPLDERPAARLFAKAVTNARMDPLVDVFLAHGVDPDTAHQHAHRPLLSALAAGRFELAERLHRAGAATSSPTDRTTVLHALVSGRATPEQLSTWLGRGLDPSALDASGQNARTFAAIEGATELTERLAEAGAAEQPEHAEAIAAAEAERRASAEATSSLRRGTVKAGAFAGMSGHASVTADGQVEAVLSIFGQETRVTMPASDFAFDDEG